MNHLTRLTVPRGLADFSTTTIDQIQQIAHPFLCVATVVALATVAAHASVSHCLTFLRLSSSSRRTNSLECVDVLLRLAYCLIALLYFPWHRVAPLLLHPLRCLSTIDPRRSDSCSHSSRFYLSGTYEDTTCFQSRPVALLQLLILATVSLRSVWLSHHGEHCV